MSSVAKKQSTRKSKKERRSKKKKTTNPNEFLSSIKEVKSHLVGKHNSNKKEKERNMKMRTDLKAKERELNRKMRSLNQRSTRLTKKRNELNKKLAKVQSHGNKLQTLETKHERKQKSNEQKERELHKEKISLRNQAKRQFKKDLKETLVEELVISDTQLTSPHEHNKHSSVKSRNKSKRKMSKLHRQKGKLQSQKKDLNELRKYGNQLKKLMLSNKKDNARLKTNPNLSINEKMRIIIQKFNRLDTAFKIKDRELRHLYTLYNKLYNTHKTSNVKKGRLLAKKINKVVDSIAINEKTLYSKRATQIGRAHV